MTMFRDPANIPTLKTSRVMLRAMTEPDFHFLLTAYSDPAVMRYWGSPAIKESGEAKALWLQLCEKLSRHQCLQWSITRSRDNQIIGTVAFFSLDFGSGRCEIGFLLARAYWGKGYMRESLHAALRYVFDEMQFRRVEADVDPRNVRSIQLLENLGFQREGYLRERWRLPGETQDSLFYGLLKREWNRSEGFFEILPAPGGVAESAPFSLMHTARLRIRHWTAVLLAFFSP